MSIKKSIWGKMNTKKAKDSEEPSAFELQNGTD